MSVGEGRQRVQSRQLRRRQVGAKHVDLRLPQEAHGVQVVLQLRSEIRLEDQLVLSSAKHNISDGVQTRATEPATRLEDGAFSPFIPGVDEDHAMVQIPVGNR